MSEGPSRPWFALVTIAILVALIVFAAMPQGREMIRQALFKAGIIYAEPMTGLD